MAGADEELDQILGKPAGVGGLQLRRDRITTRENPNRSGSTGKRICCRNLTEE
jgi:hypothetical protein